MKTTPARAEALLRLMQAWFGWTASGRWRIDEDATVERWQDIQWSLDPNVGSYHDEALRRVVNHVRSDRTAVAIEELRGGLNERGDPWLKGWLAALLDATGRGDEARGELQGLVGGSLMMAFFGMTFLQDEALPELKGPFIRVGRLLHDAFGPESMPSAIVGLTEALRAGELSDSDSPFVLELLPLDRLAQHAAFELVSWLLRLAPTPLPELVSDQLARACMIAWCDDALTELFGGSATLARRLREGQRQWVAVMLDSAAGLISIPGDQDDGLPDDPHSFEFSWDDLTTSWWMALVPFSFEHGIRGAFADAESLSGVHPGFLWWLASGRPLETVARAVRAGWIELDDFDADLLAEADWRDSVTRLAEPDREVVRIIVHYATTITRQQEFDEAFPPRER